MNKLWSDEAWEDLFFWHDTGNRKNINKIKKLIKDIERNGAFMGEGHPEPLKGELAGWFSRRIDDKNRLVYRVFDDTVEIIQCRQHYDDK